MNAEILRNLVLTHELDKQLSNDFLCTDYDIDIKFKISNTALKTKDLLSGTDCSCITQDH